MGLNIGTSDNHHFLFGVNGKVVVLGVPILKHIRVFGLPELIKQLLPRLACCMEQPTLGVHCFSCIVSILIEQLDVTCQANGRWKGQLKSK